MHVPRCVIEAKSCGFFPKLCRERAAAADEGHKEHGAPGVTSSQQPADRGSSCHSGHWCE